MKKHLKKGFAVVAGLGSSAVAFAQETGAAGPDMTQLTSQIGWSGVGTAVMSIGAGLALLYATIKGAKIVIGMVKGG
jgi:hypothetical protein